jgi:ribosomal protein S1
MKKTIAIVLSLVLMFAFTAVTFAAEKEAASAEKKSAAAEKKSAAAEKKSADAAKKAVKKQVTGDVTAVDAKANTLTVKGKKGDVMVSTDDKTKVMAGKDAKTLADVKVGDKVTVKYTEADGKNVAAKVAIMAAPAKKAEKKEAAPAMKEAAPAEKAAPAAPAKKKAAGY